MDSNLVIQLCTTSLCDIKRAVVMQKVVVRPTSTHPRFFFINLALLQREKWRKYVQITSDNIQHLCETIMSHKFLLKWTGIWWFTILVARHMSPLPSTLPQPQHVLCRTAMLYQVVRLNFCPFGRTFSHHRTFESGCEKASEDMSGSLFVIVGQ